MELFHSFTTGMVFGLSAGLAPGPLLAMVVTQTLKYNTKEGVKVSFAPLITDFPIIIISLVILTRISNYERLLGAVSIVGGFYVLFLAYESVRTLPLDIGSAKDLPCSIKKGAIINALNPHPYLFWITVGAPLTIKFYQQSVSSSVVFIGCFYILLIGSKVFLALIAGKSKEFLRGRAYRAIMRVLGILLLLFAIFLLKDGFILLNKG